VFWAEPKVIESLGPKDLKGTPPGTMPTPPGNVPTGTVATLPWLIVSRCAAGAYPFTLRRHYFHESPWHPTRGVSSGSHRVL
jgi:hypothetical protein